jgi:hypothetical protein
MDPISIATGAVSLLGPYIAKGAEAFAKELGKEAAQKAKELYSYLKNSFAADSEESQVLSLFEKKPEKYEVNLANVLQERTSTDNDFATELEKLVYSAAPYIKVVQSLKEGKKVVAADVREAKAGTFDIQQHIEKGDDVTGFRADKVG